VITTRVRNVTRRRAVTQSPARPSILPDGPARRKGADRPGARPLAPAGRPRHTRGMDAERDDYGEPDGPPSRVDMHLLALVVLGVAFLVACTLWNRFATFGP
jgi:hypothetical protein